ncbi:MAG TPA: DUF192 domain-containing protein [Dehalococcoidia bacterium]|nr:DUF192 domain-containing protein [Dehalococcoidia bacterium]
MSPAEMPSRLQATVSVAGNPLSRFLGLMGRSRLEPDCALVIRPCSSIHTFFMRFPIDVVFIDLDSRVVKIAENVKPWRIMLGGKGAHAVVELAGGVLAGTAITVGDQLDLAA